jgi:SAM-dependent methyltransferase
VVADLDVNENSDIYYQGRYWNDFDVVTRRINERISGDPTRPWFEQFAKISERTFERALILNCGNGWVERELLSSGLILEAVGIDYSEDLLAQARTAAAEGGLPLTYEKVNVNTAAFPEGEFDLVVNHAAAHHIAAIDRVFRELCRMLPDDGWFVCFDYVGPHRNQYTPEAWEELWAVNRQLPASLRQDLRYPHLPTMLATDPTEAVHSELILDTFHRYFTVGELTPLGGAIAYPLLTHNTRLFDAADPAEQSVWLDRILAADDRFLAGHPDSSLFAYFSGTPDKSVLDQGDRLAKWEAEEEEREQRAAANGGEYYVRGALATALIALDAEEWEHVRLSEKVETLQAQVAALESGLLYSTVKRLADAKATRRIRSNRAMATLERRARAARLRSA